MALLLSKKTRQASDSFKPRVRRLNQHYFNIYKLTLIKHSLDQSFSEDCVTITCIDCGQRLIVQENALCVVLFPAKKLKCEKFTVVFWIASYNGTVIFIFLDGLPSKNRSLKKLCESSHGSSEQWQKKERRWRGKRRKQFSIALEVSDSILDFV